VVYTLDILSHPTPIYRRKLSYVGRATGKGVSGKLSLETGFHGYDHCTLKTKPVAAGRKNAVSFGIPAVFHTPRIESIELSYYGLQKLG